MEQLNALFDPKENAAEIIAKGAAWEDTSFPHDNSVVEGLGGPFKWARASELYRKKEKVYDSFSPNDIVQGSLGDCYLLSAISSLAEFPGRVERIFSQKERNDAGCYAIKFFLSGQFVEVAVDDYFPLCPVNPTRPNFTSTNTAELWVMLIEKAWAKLHRDFPVVEGGDSRESYVALTGAPTDFYKHNEQKQEKFWEIVKKADEECYVMSAGTVMDVKGIMRDHAYSLINAYEFMDKGKQVRLVQVRNPWGSDEWTGEWCDKDSRWTPQLCKQLNHTPQEDGMFFMSFKDFFTVFDHTFICKANDDYVHSSLAVEGKKAFAAFNILQPTKGFVSGYVVTSRLGKVLTPGYTLPIIKLELYEIGKNEVKLVTGGYSNALGQANLEVDLQPGIYALKASFERTSKLPWVCFCGYTDNAFDLIKLDVNDIFEINYQDASKLFKTISKLDTTGVHQKKKAGRFRRCLAGHRLTWSAEVVAGEETFTCRSCDSAGDSSAGRWLCGECNYNVCVQCRHKLPERKEGGRRRKGKENAEEKAEEKTEENQGDKRPLQEQPQNEVQDEEETKVIKKMVVTCGCGCNMEFVEVAEPNTLYQCDDCGRVYYGSVKRWFCDGCKFDLCRKCLEPPDEFKDEVVKEFDTCFRGDKLEFVVQNTRNGVFDCSLCGKKGYAQNGRWWCRRCNFNLCTTCKPCESAKETVIVDVSTMTCTKDHILVFSCRPPETGALRCEKCKRNVGPDNWRWTCEKCRFNVCPKCRVPPEGRQGLICPEMHMLTQSNLPQNNANYGRCDSCHKPIKYTDGRYCCLPCQYEFCNACINKILASMPS